MIESKTQYRVVCDSQGCGCGTALHHDHTVICKQAMSDGWEILKVVIIPGVYQNALWRCPKCVKAGKVPEG